MEPLKKGTHVCILRPHAPLRARLPRRRRRRAGKAPLPARGGASAARRLNASRTHRARTAHRHPALGARLQHRCFAQRSRHCSPPAALAALLAARVPVPGRADAGQGTHRRSGCQHDAAAGSHWPADRAPAPMALGAARARPSALALHCMIRQRFLFLLRFFVCLYVSSLGLKTESVLRKTAHTFIVGTRLRGRDPPQLWVGTAEGQL